ncbi:MAG TPA: bifunctional aspartate kinase/homoserine dehydrogenase I [Vicinamibacterales bacterium]|nr:bifunctional aspartate kinase/homoserine dehydrogenase I [Vicinamibacterales bacterium]
MQPWRVHKFGGSSVADAACMARVARILEDDPRRRVAAVLSACRGVTDALLALVTAAERQEDGDAVRLDALRQRHVAIANALLGEADAAEYGEELGRDCRDIAGILQTVRLVRIGSAVVRDLVAGFGEIWSTRLFARYLRARNRRTGGVHWIDAREIVRIDAAPLGPSVLWPESRANADSVIPTDADATLIITGFIARTRDGLQTTLGRNGSDFSGSIFGALLDASDIVIWTDVDGVLSADPRRVPDATVIDALSYNEAMELAYFGAKVIHPQTMAPAVSRSIPIWIRNTFAPEKAGTIICAAPVSSHPVKGITSIDAVALINVEGTGMIGVPGTAQRLFGALREHGISVVLISQGSSEHSICFALEQAEAERAAAVVREVFDRELRQGQIQRVDVTRDCSILAVVGDGMAGTPGIAAKLFNALGASGVNVRAIAQGASERNISVVIDRAQTARALGSVHAGFYLSPHTISIGLIGPGLVGSAFLDQLASQAERLRREFRLDLRLRGILASKKMLLADTSVPVARWREAIDSAGPPDLRRFVEHVDAVHLPHAVIVDCTASGVIARKYPDWLAAGIHVVTPNKQAGSADMAFYRTLAEARRTGGSHYLYEATVGAGLPIIQTVRDLRETGDRIQTIEGILSGTLSYLFNVWDGEQPFSALVRSAKAQGFTEPDPREDLSGTDVARKLIILAREIGLDLELADVELEGLVPESLRSATAEEFLVRLPELDAAMRDRFEAARSHGQVLRYVGRLDADTRRATVGLVEIDRSHLLANMSLTDNLVSFTTSRYNRNPLVVRGPGAGPAVTAGGVFGDLLRVCAYLGARL